MIHKIYCFIATFFISLIIYRYESKEEKSTLTIKKIEHYYSTTIIIFLIIFLWVFVDFVIYVFVKIIIQYSTISRQQSIEANLPLLLKVLSIMQKS